MELTFHQTIVHMYTQDKVPHFGGLLSFFEGHPRSFQKIIGLTPQTYVYTLNFVILHYFVCYMILSIFYQNARHNFAGH